MSVTMNLVIITVLILMAVSIAHAFLMDINCLPMDLFAEVSRQFAIKLVLYSS